MILRNTTHISEVSSLIHYRTPFSNLIRSPSVQYYFEFAGVPIIDKNSSVPANCHNDKPSIMYVIFNKEIKRNHIVHGTLALEFYLFLFSAHVKCYKLQNICECAMVTFEGVWHLIINYMARSNKYLWLYQATWFGVLRSWAQSLNLTLAMIVTILVEGTWMYPCVLKTKNVLFLDPICKSLRKGPLRCFNILNFGCFIMTSSTFSRVRLHILFAFHPKECIIVQPEWFWFHQ